LAAKSASARRSRDAPPALAKLTRPRLGQAYRRARLFGLLDRARRQPLVWLSAPAGSGKTTLAASYLEARRLRHLWYQLDARDADPATFFYYLRLAAQRLAPRRRESLPLLTPEYFLGLPAFTRNFFEELGRRLRPPTLIVLDNYQDVPESAPLHGLLADAAALLPRGVSLVVLSRSDPPASYARLRAQRAIAPLGWEELRLQRAELPAYVRSHGRKPLAAPAFARLYEQTQGWAAGVTLLLEPRAVAAPAAAANAPLFAYFAAELFGRAGAGLQQFLMSTALLPDVDVPAAQALTDNPAAGEILADLARRNFFTVRLPGAAPGYRYHPLFREFLLREAAARLAPEALRERQRRGAALLTAAGRFEDALALLTAAGDPDGLAALLERFAPQLAAQGRLTQLGEWLNALPETARAARPWLEYWFGTSRLPFCPLTARAHYERAWRGFERAGDAAGQYLAWVGIAESFMFLWDDFTGLEPWLAELERLRARCPDYPDAATEARVTAAVFGALMYVAADEARIAPWRSRAEALVYAGGDGNFRLQTANGLLLHYVWMGRLGEQQRLVALAGRLTADPSLSPLARLHGVWFRAVHAWLGGETDAAMRAADEAARMAEQSGVRLLDTLILAQSVYACGIKGDLATMAGLLERIRARLAPDRRLDLSHYYYQAGWHAELRGELDAARAQLRQGAELARRLGPVVPQGLVRIALAQVLALRGEHAAAEAELEWVAAHARAMDNRHWRFMVALLRAFLALQARSAPECARFLAEVCTLGAEHGFYVYPNWNPRVVTPLAAFAFEHDIAPGYVRHLIALHRLRPDGLPAALERWPYPLKIHTLGRFGVRANDRPVDTGVKSHKKPLELLKALIAFGGRAVAETTVIDALWPQADGDRGRQNLKATVHRLRALLGADALIHKDGRLALDPRHCWVDLWALERAVNEASACLAQPDPAALLAAGERALALYRGPFLGDEPLGFALAARERLRSRLLRLIEALGQALCEAGERERACAWYQRGLELDPLAERFYQGLMHCYRDLDRPAEALAAYRRCQDVLERTLGVEPGPETRALHRSLQTLRN
jgi:DNA-binding SARP family transcriptional activator